MSTRPRLISNLKNYSQMISVLDEQPYQIVPLSSGTVYAVHRYRFCGSVPTKCSTHLHRILLRMEAKLLNSSAATQSRRCFNVWYRQISSHFPTAHRPASGTATPPTASRPGSASSPFALRDVLEPRGDEHEGRPASGKVPTTRVRLRTSRFRRSIDVVGADYGASARGGRPCTPGSRGSLLADDPGGLAGPHPLELVRDRERLCLGGLGNASAIGPTMPDALSPTAIRTPRSPRDRSRDRKPRRHPEDSVKPSTAPMTSR